MNLPQLNPRERLAIIVGGLFVLAAILYLGVISPYQSTLSRLDARIASRQKQVREIQALRQDYLLLQRQLNEAENRLDKATGFSLFSFVEASATREAGRENLVYMRPQTGSSQEGFREESVEIKLEKLRLDQLVRFLYSFESAEAALQVKNLRIRTRFDDRSLLDAVMTVSMYGRAA
ncbi:MAG: type II secretion system protein GspM [Desulfuromonadales bacterium]